jgi:hypothetical protein
MADQEKVKDVEVKKPKISKPTIKKPKVIKPKYDTKKYPLIVDVPIGDKIVKKGTLYPLTKEGAKYFKSKFYIK